MVITYKRNNIIFRIASADAIGKFKSAQAHAFLQLARRDLQFDETAREAVLLEFDYFSNWLFRMERIFLSSNGGFLPPTLRSAIFESFIDELRVIEGVMDANSPIFSTDLRAYVKVIHQYSAKILAHGFEQISLSTIDVAYSNMVGLINGYLQHVLTAMHEFNNNVAHRSDPFISIAEFSLSGADPSRLIPVCDRLKFFRSMGCGDVYELKNYTADENIMSAFLAVAPDEVTIFEKEPSEITAQ